MDSGGGGSDDSDGGDWRWAGDGDGDISETSNEEGIGNENGTDTHHDSDDWRTENGGTERSNGVRGWARWFWYTDNGVVSVVRDIASSLLIVVLIGALLFAVTGIWPPMVAVESESMTPHLQKGDLVVVTEEHRFANGAATDGTGVVTYETGRETGYSTFGQAGNVIIYRRYGVTNQTPVIHRARFWVDKGENWYDEANRSYLGGARNCAELSNCPAPHAGFITKGDHNTEYDQVGTTRLNPALGEGVISSPVKPSWVVGTAKFRIPWLGKIKLAFTPGTPALSPPAAHSNGIGLTVDANGTGNTAETRNTTESPNLSQIRAPRVDTPQVSTSRAGDATGSEHRTAGMKPRAGPIAALAG